MLSHCVLCRPSQYLRKLRKYSVGRESISAVVFGTLTAVRVLRPVVSGTLSAVVVFHPVASHTLSAVTILARNEEAFCRPSECFLDLRKYSVGRESTPSRSIGNSVGRESIPFHSIGNSVGRCSIPSCSTAYSVGRHNTFAIRGSTLSAVRVLPRFEKGKDKIFVCPRLSLKG